MERKPETGDNWVVVVLFGATFFLGMLVGSIVITNPARVAVVTATPQVTPQATPDLVGWAGVSGGGPPTLLELPTLGELSRVGVQPREGCVFLRRLYCPPGEATQTR